MGWVEIVLLVLWSLGVIANVLVGHKPQYRTVSPGDAVFGALLSAGVATSLLLWAQPLTAFGMLLVAYYCFWTVASLLIALAGGYETATWWRVFNVLLGLSLITLLLTVGVTA